VFEFEIKCEFYLMTGVLEFMGITYGLELVGNVCVDITYRLKLVTYELEVVGNVTNRSW